MGAWGCGPFDNDGAWDYVDELANDPAEVTETLRRAMMEVLDSSDYLDVDQINAAIVAACLVAERLSPGLVSAPELRQCAERLAPSASHDFRPLAARVFDRAFEPGDNEWYELWQESEAMAEVRAEHGPFQNAVTGVSR